MVCDTKVRYSALYQGPVVFPLSVAIVAFIDCGEVKLILFLTLNSAYYQLITC
jgi:hypothetical protein